MPILRLCNSGLTFCVLFHLPNLSIDRAINGLKASTGPNTSAQLSAACAGAEQHDRALLFRHRCTRPRNSWQGSYGASACISHARTGYLILTAHWVGIQAILRSRASIKHRLDMRQEMACIVASSWDVKHLHEADQA